MGKILNVHDRNISNVHKDLYEIAYNTESKIQIIRDKIYNL
jgi:hypothetical protein